MRPSKGCDPQNRYSPISTCSPPISTWWAPRSRDDPLPQPGKRAQKILEPVKTNTISSWWTAHPHTQGLITVNANTAADSVVVPVQTRFFALEGLGKLPTPSRSAQNRLNPSLKIEGILMTMYDGRFRLCNQVVSEVRRRFRRYRFQAASSTRNTRLGEGPVSANR